MIHFFKRNSLGVILILSIILCLWAGYRYFAEFHIYGISKDTTNWGTFGDYIGGVIGTILSFISVILIYITYKSQVKQAYDQQFETTFFNLLETYRLSIERLQRKADDLKGEYNRVQDEESYFETLNSKDFFDVLYFILDRNYKEQIHTRNVSEKISPFFKNHYWLIGQYIRNFFSIIEFVEAKNIPEKQKYIDILRDMATIDELRLLFYTIIWKQNSEGKHWKKLFSTYQIIDYIGNDKDDKKLIDTMADLNAYNNI